MHYKESQVVQIHISNVCIQENAYVKNKGAMVYMTVGELQRETTVMRGTAVSNEIVAM